MVYGFELIQQTPKEIFIFIAYSKEFFSLMHYMYLISVTNNITIQQAAILTFNTTSNKLSISSQIMQGGFFGLSSSVFFLKLLLY